MFKLFTLVALLATVATINARSHGYLRSGEPEPIKCLRLVPSTGTYKNTTCRAQQLGPQWARPACMSLHHFGIARPNGYHCSHADSKTAETCQESCPQTLSDTTEISATCCCLTTGCQKLDPVPVAAAPEYYDEE